MAGQMCWLPRFGHGEELVLHLRLQPYQPWSIYTSIPGLSVPDYNVPQGSKGWATCQNLSKNGWTVIPMSQARQRSFEPDLIDQYRRA